MSIPGLGIRTANDVLMEASLGMVEPILVTRLTAPVASGFQTVSIATGLGTTGQNVLYVGAQLVVDTGANAEVITLTGFTQEPAAPSITAVFAKSHLANVPLSGATFPIQEATDPIFTQSEMLTYLSRAQNEFLQACPCVFALSYQTAMVGQIQQTMPNNVIELCRVATSSTWIPFTSLVRSGYVVTATTSIPHGRLAGSTFWVQNATDATFNGVFAIVSVISPTVFTYQQIAADATNADGDFMYFYRLYELTQQEMFMSNRQWQNQFLPPTGFFEDRSGLYGWGLNSKPPYSIPLELLAAIRDTDSLSLIDGFAIPDLLLHYVKFNVLSSVWGKDGCWQDTERAKYYDQRWQRGVAAVNRYLDAMLPIAQGQG